MPAAAGAAGGGPSPPLLLRRRAGHDRRRRWAQLARQQLRALGAVQLLVPDHALVQLLRSVGLESVEGQIKGRVNAGRAVRLTGAGCAPRASACCR